ncbi:hypothetical protein GW17_00010885 [Ensete ventricosum]|nr:hypothetical protein GW17_00010885 [Ensete ventricosum]
MAEEQQQQGEVKSKVDSEESWDLFTTQADDRGCPVFVHFGASWCVPSLAMNTCFQELANSYPDILFLLVDDDDMRQEGVASRMEVKAMPTFVLMKHGMVVLSKLVGANPEEMSGNHQ